MKAIRVHEFGDTEVLKLEEITDPQPAAGQVLIKVHAVGVNPLDTYIREQSHGAPTPTLPYIPGFDAAGVVEAIGSGVTRFKVGDRIYTNTFLGAYAERMVCDESIVYPLPANVSFAQGAAIPSSYPTAHYALFTLARAVPGETVFVHGASGGVGIAAVQIARAAGFTVVGTAGSDRGMELVKQEGAHYVLNHREPDYLEKALALTNGRGFDVILEMNATKKLAEDINLIAPMARIIVIGGTYGAVNLDPGALLWKGASIIGLYVNLAEPQQVVQMHKAIYAGLENGTLRPVVGQEFAFGDAGLAHKAVEASASFGKIVLVWRSSS